MKRKPAKNPAFAAALLTLLLALLLSACGAAGAGKEPEPTPTPEPTPSPTPPPTEWTVAADETAEEILALADIPTLKTVDATGSREYAAIVALHEQRPDIAMTWNYEFQGQSYPNDTTELTVTDLTGLEDAIRFLPEVNYIDLINSPATVEDLDRYDAIRPGIFYYWSFVHKDVHGYYLIRTDLQAYSTLHSTASSEGLGLKDEDMYPMLKYCRHLKALDLGHNDLTDESIRLIGELKELEVLIIADNPRLVDASPLGNLSNLSFLEIFMCHNVEDFSFLNRLTNLDMLEACYCDHLTSLDFLANMPNFKVGMFKSTGLTPEEFNEWVPKLPEGAWMVYWDGDIYSTGSGWRLLVKTDQIRNAFFSWRYITDYRHYNDYDADLTKVNVPQVSADFVPGVDQLEDPQNGGYNDYAWW